LALVVLSVVEQRLDAVRAVLDGADVVEVAARVGVHRATVHRWVARYLTGQLAGLADRSHRPATLMFYDLATRELLRTRKNPLTPQQVKRLRGARPAGPPPRPSAEPVRVQRRASNTGVIMVVGQKVALGRIHKHQTVAVLVSDTTLAVELADGDVRVIRRTTTQPVRSIKGQRPRTSSGG
jgi:transposase-like protein